MAAAAAAAAAGGGKSINLYISTTVVDYRWCFNKFFYAADMGPVTGPSVGQFIDFLLRDRSHIT